MGFSIELSFFNFIFFGFLYYCSKKAYAYYKSWKIQELLDKWNNTPKGKVILHGIPRGINVPNVSPFCLKLETYLRMAEIPYEFEGKDSFGAKGNKSPWISFNGTHVEDSSAIITFLNKKFEKNLNQHLSPDQKEICRAITVMLENHFYFGVMSWRWVESLSSIDQIMKFPKFVRVLLGFQSKKVEKVLNSQGIGRHSFTERTEMTAADLKTVSVILGKKNFIGGQNPCEEDCAIFGQIAQIVWAAPGSNYEKLIEGELANLKQYSERMKDKFWPDWILCLDKTTDYY